MSGETGARVLRAERVYEAALAALAGTCVPAAAWGSQEAEAAGSAFGIQTFDPGALRCTAFRVPTTLLNPDGILTNAEPFPITEIEPSIEEVCSAAASPVAAGGAAAQLERTGAHVCVSPAHEDVSLFDAAGYIAAVAAAQEDGRIARVRIEFGGIQNFVYTIGSKYALKVLRGRSAYVDLLLDVLVHEISGRCGMGPYGVLFAAGGNAEAIVPPSCAGIASEVVATVGEFLQRELGPELSLVCVCADVKIDGTEAGAWAEATDVLHSDVRSAKLAPHAGRLAQVLGVARNTADPERACPICGRDTALTARLSTADDEPIDVCEPCATFERLGEQLPTIHAFRRVDEGNIGFESGEPPALPFGVCRYRGDARDAQQARNGLGDRDYAVNAFSGAARRFWYAQVRDERAKELQYCANGAPGGYVAALRADVDGLGARFHELAGEPLRAATLSRQLTYFFRFLSNGFVGERTSFVYAGGDDVFAVGAWDQVLLLAEVLRARFRTYFADLDVSAGIALAKVKTPLYQLAKVSGDLVEQAKSYGKGRLGLSIGVYAGGDGRTHGNSQNRGFDDEGRALLTWDAWSSVKSLREELGALLEADKAFAYRLIEVGREFNNTGALAFPRLAYAIARSRLGRVREDKSALARSLADKLLEPERGTLLAPIGVLLSLSMRPIGTEEA